MIYRKNNFLFLVLLLLCTSHNNKSIVYTTPILTGGTIAFSTWYLLKNYYGLNRAVKNNNFPLVKLIMSIKAYSPSILNNAIRTAVEQGNRPMVELLISQGLFDLDLLLKIAVQKGHIEVVNLLIEQGAQNLAQALQIALQNKHPLIAALIKAKLSDKAKDIEEALKSYAIPRVNPTEITDFLLKQSKK